MTNQPNILFVFTDQQSLQTLSCRGNAYCNTPYIDNLASEGVRFEQSYCAAPVCGPSRAAMVTGLMPHEAGVDYNGQALRPEAPTFGERLRVAGYHTVWIGKWHLPASRPDVHHAAQVRGYDYQPRPTGMTNYEGLGDVTDGHDTTNAIFQLRWNLAQQSRPWCLSVSLHNPHDICRWMGYPPVRHANVDRYPPLPENMPPVADESEAMELFREACSNNAELGNSMTWDEHQWRAYLNAYYQMTEQIDLNVGRILLALEAGGWADNTLVIFTSDHGESCAGHRYVAKLTPYQEAMTVPLIVRAPDLPTGQVDEASLVSGIDVPATICDYAQADSTGLRGRSLRRMIQDPEANRREALVSELALRNPASKDGQAGESKARIVRTSRYKYVAFDRHARPEMLFDLAEDPGETTNIAGQADSAAVVREHRGHLRRWLDEIGDPFDAPAGD
jgi:choline-sulfatase